MSGASSIVESAVPVVVSQRSLNLAAAAWLSVALALFLGVLAFWPAPAWVPPRRPTLKGPMVFDEFVNAASPPVASSNAADPVLH